jgi:hypothetical protein
MLLRSFKYITVISLCCETVLVLFIFQYVYKVASMPMEASQSHGSFFSQYGQSIETVRGSHRDCQGLQ